MRQGDPLSPLLFVLGGDILQDVVNNLVSEHLLDLPIQTGDSEFPILQYADDTILFMEHDPQKAVNMKLILCIFEQLSVLKINFHKSEIFCFGKAKDAEAQYKHIFGCESGSLPFHILGYLSIIENFVISSGIQQTVALWLSLDVGKENYFLMATD